MLMQGAEILFHIIKWRAQKEFLGKKMFLILFQQVIQLIDEHIFPVIAHQIKTALLNTEHQSIETISFSSNLISVLR